MGTGVCTGHTVHITYTHTHACAYTCTWAHTQEVPQALVYISFVQPATLDKDLKLPSQALNTWLQRQADPVLANHAHPTHHIDLALAKGHHCGFL